MKRLKLRKPHRFHGRNKPAETKFNVIRVDQIFDEDAEIHSDSEDSVTDFGSDFSDIDFDRMSVTSWPSEDGAPDVKVMPCCRRGDTVVVGD
jgi:hypothetical protein